MKAPATVMCNAVCVCVCEHTFACDLSALLCHMQAMVNFLDDQLLNFTTKMKDLDMWDNTLMVLSSDNGGYVKNYKGGCNTTSGYTSHRYNAYIYIYIYMCYVHVPMHACM